MKFTPLPSVSSSLSENYCTSKGNAFGCFAGVLSRILCSKTLPTHPSSDPIELDSNRLFSKMEDRIPSDGSGTPNVVARLMGLDTMPEISAKSIGFIQRSKSMDSEETRAKTEHMQSTNSTTHHRRVKTCVSFRETQEFFELEDDNFLVLSFDNRGGNHKKASNSGNSEVGIKGYKNQRRREKCRRKQIRNRDEQGKDRLMIISPIFDVSKQSYYLSPLKDKISGKIEELEFNKARKKKKKKKKKENFMGESESKDEAEIDSENLSPVSVLDHDTEFINDIQVTTSVFTSQKEMGRTIRNGGSTYFGIFLFKIEEDARLGVSESVSTNYASESSQISERERDGNIERHVALKRRNYKKHENVEMSRKICRLVEVDIKNSNNWKYRRILRCDELEDTARDFGQGIFDQLVTELLDQLLGFECHQI